MKLTRTLLLVIVAAMLACSAGAQLATFSFPAGSPEDVSSDAILKESDGQKRLAMWNDFVQKFASNSLAVAYGEWQLAQIYQTSGDLKAAREAGDKGLQAAPNALDLATTMATIAQAQKDYAGVVTYAAKGAAAFNSIARQPKPEGVADEDFAKTVKRQQEAAQPSYEFLEGAAMNAIMQEQGTAARVALAKQFSSAFPKSKYAAQVAQYAIIALLQASDYSGLSSYGEQAVKENPGNATIVMLVASGYSEDAKSPAHLQQAAAYAQRAADLASAQKDLSEEQKNSIVGAAKSALGWSLLRQEKTAAAIPELKAAEPLLKSSPNDYAKVLFGLGYAYAKLNRAAEAKAVLAQASAIAGPYQQPARDLLQKVGTPRPAQARAKQ